MRKTVPGGDGALHAPTMYCTTSSVSFASPASGNFQSFATTTAAVLFAEHSRHSSRQRFAARCLVYIYAKNRRTCTTETGHALGSWAEVLVRTWVRASKGPVAYRLGGMACLRDISVARSFPAYSVPNDACSANTSHVGGYACGSSMLADPQKTTTAKIVLLP